MISHRRVLARLFPPRYADSHAHLDRYPDGAVLGMVRRARAAGVTRIVTVGSGIDSSRRAIALARRYRGRLVAAAGIHPRYAGGLDLEALRRLVAEDRDAVRAIGEIGLDRSGQVATPLKVQT